MFEFLVMINDTGKDWQCKCIYFFLKIAVEAKCMLLDLITLITNENAWLYYVVRLWFMSNCLQKGRN